MLAARESAVLAEKLITATCDKQAITRGQLTIHADRGSSMTSKPVAFLLADPGVTQSHSRPHVCPLTGQSQRFSRSATRRDVWGCLRGGDGGDAPVRHEHGESLAAA